MNDNLEWLKFELSRVNNCLENIQSDLQLIHVEIAKLKLKAGIWGLIAGGIPVLIMLASWLFLNKI